MAPASHGQELTMTQTVEDDSRKYGLGDRMEIEKTWLHSIIMFAVVGETDRVLGNRDF